jgi:hypothetical protein
MERVEVNHFNTHGVLHGGGGEAMLITNVETAPVRC